MILFEIWILEFICPILRSGGACNLLFPIYPGLGPFELVLCPTEVDLRHFVAKHFRHQDTKTQTKVERFRVQRSGLENAQPDFIKRILP